MIAQKAIRDIYEREHMTDRDFAILTDRTGGVAIVTLNRPEKLNAFADTMRDDLLEALDRIANDSSTRAVVITGAGRAFCAGGDVPAMGDLQRRDDREAFRKLLETGAGIVTRIRSMPQIVIAAVNGVAAGAGCNLALACDYRIASEEAKFSQAFVRIGLHPDWGGSWSLPRLIGPTRALEILATGRMVSAVEALTLGMVDRVTPPEQLRHEAVELAEAIAAGPADAVADIKRAVWASLANSLEAQLAIETENQLRAFLSKNGREGVAAFLEKRPAEFD